MKIAVFSDIHSNYSAFLACYLDALAHNAKSFIFLGDYVSDLAEPQQTMDLIYEIHSQFPTICLRGNRERYMLECHDGISSFTPGSKTGSLLFTYKHLRKRDFDFFRSLKISDKIELDGIQIEIAHAAIDDDRRYFDNQDGNANHIFSTMQCDYLLTGHSHKQYILQKSGKTILNPGSVGIPQGGSPWPKYAMLETANGSISCTLREVVYEMAQTIHAQFASGLVNDAKYWAIGVLYDLITGQECVLNLLNHIAASGNVHDETIWHNAAVQSGMCLTEEEILSFYREITTSLRSRQY